MLPAVILVLILVGVVALALLITVATRKEVDNNGLRFEHDLRKK